MTQAFQKTEDKQEIIKDPRAIKVKRALLSVSDKNGLVDFAKKLSDFGIEILSTGGTAKTMKEAGLNITDVFITHSTLPFTWTAIHRSK